MQRPRRPAALLRTRTSRTLERTRDRTLERALESAWESDRTRARRATTHEPRTSGAPGSRGAGLPKRSVAAVALVLSAVATPIAAGVACPVELAQVVPDAALRTRLHNGGVQLPLAPEAVPALVPAVAGGDTIRAAIAPAETTRSGVYGTELLRLIPHSGPPCDWVGLYDLLRAISTLQGIEYYSNSRGRYRTLFKESHVVAGPHDLTPQPDPVATTVPERHALHLLQVDSTFGKNVYRADYRFDGVSITLQLQNLTTMWWHVFPLVPVGGYRSLVLVTPTDHGLLFYAVAAIPAPDLKLLRKRGQTSLRYRVDALERWLRERVRTTG